MLCPRDSVGNLTIEKAIPALDSFSTNQTVGWDPIEPETPPQNMPLGRPLPRHFTTMASSAQGVMGRQATTGQP